MQLNLTADQEALQRATAQLCAGVFPRDVLRLAMEEGLDRTRWRRLAEAGVFALRRPEADGGVGLGMAEATLVFEELGRALVPGPLVGTHLAAGAIDGAAPDDIIGIVPIEPDGSVYVEHLSSLDWLVVLGGDRRGVGMVDGDQLRALAEPAARPLDPLTPIHRVLRPPPFQTIGGPEETGRWHRDGALLVAAQAAGLAAAVVDIAAGYALERQQFDRPIGSFQAVKHLLADMMTNAELARAAVEAAAVTLDQPEVGDPDEMVHTAKVMAGEAAIANSRSSVQIHGGMGFAWDADAHLYLKRAWVLDHQFGSGAAHARRLAEAALQRPGPEDVTRAVFGGGL